MPLVSSLREFGFESRHLDSALRVPLFLGRNTASVLFDSPVILRQLARHSQSSVRAISLLLATSFSRVDPSAVWVILFRCHAAYNVSPIGIGTRHHRFPHLQMIDLTVCTAFSASLFDCWCNEDDVMCLIP